MTLILIAIVVFEIVKRPVFWVLYPVAYVFREWARAKRNLLWLALDDSIRNENLTEWKQDKEYCLYGKRCGIIEDYLKEGPFKEFCRSWYWGAWRNNGINLMTAIEKWVGLCQEIRYVNNALQKRLFACGYWLPYFEYWLGGYRLQVGFLTCGRPQVQLRKLK